MWLAPFTNGIYNIEIPTSVYHTLSLPFMITPLPLGMDHVISLQFRRIESIALIRFWNYNKSRTYSFRGARLVEITLDGSHIFKGEIAKAQGDVTGIWFAGSCIDRF